MIAAYHFIAAHWLALSIGGLLVFGIASNPVAALAFVRKHWHLLLVALLLFVAYEWGAHTQKIADMLAMNSHLTEDARQQAKDAQDLLKIAEKVRAQEHKLAAANAAAGEQYEKGKRDAEAAGKRVADDLRAGNLKLRKEWRGCEVRVSGSAADPAVADAEARLREASAGRIVSTVSACQAQRDGLQDILRAERP